MPISWAKKTYVIWLTGILTIASILIEFTTEVWDISLKPVWKDGVLSYVKVEPSGIPPVMIIVVTSVLFITSIIIWRKQRWPVYFLGVMSMAAAPLINSVLKTDAAHNITEFLLVSALLSTYHYQQYRSGVTHS